jgi:hypothetical protein
MAGKRWSALLLVVLLILESTVATFQLGEEYQKLKAEQSKK